MKMKVIAEEKRKIGRMEKVRIASKLPKARMMADDTDNSSNATNTYAVEQIEQAAGEVLYRSVKILPMVHKTINGYRIGKKQSEERVFTEPSENKETNDPQIISQDIQVNFNPPKTNVHREDNARQKHPKATYDTQSFVSSGNTYIEKSPEPIPPNYSTTIPMESADITFAHDEDKLIQLKPQLSKANTTMKNISVDKSVPKHKPLGPIKTRQVVERRSPSKHIRPEKDTKALITKTIAQRYAERGKDHFKRNAQAHVIQQSQKTITNTTAIIQKVSIAISSTAKSLGLWLVGLVGGIAVVMLFGFLLLFGTVAASPLGILFSNESIPGSVPLSAAVEQINTELNTRLSNLQNGDYTNIDISGSSPDWAEVVAVFASHTAGAEYGMDVTVLDARRVMLLRNTFWDMCSISTSVERIEQPTTDETTPPQPSEVILHIRISARSADEMRTIYDFTDFQNEVLDLLLAERISIASMVGNLSVSQEDAIAVLEALPATLSPERKAVVQQALSLVGKVNYFWGGKSLVIGWDNRWGQLTKVTAPGSRTTGTFRPYGLDCSGFVDWVFYNASGGNYIIGHGGGAGSQHRHCTDISWSEAQPGDLVFYYNDDHIGIVGGWDVDGNLLIIHCASGQNNVVITRKSGFISVARPIYYEE